MSTSPPQQLSLGVSLNDEATFANFYVPPGSVNAQAVGALEGQLQAGGEPFIYLWGAAGAGLTHLLQAACHRAHAGGRYAQYLPLRDLAGFAPQSLLEGMEVQDLVCLDGIERVAGNPVWEEALFDCFNRLRDHGRRLLVAGVYGPREVPVRLEDLRSRLNWGVTFQMQLLDDAGKQAALQLRAKGRGMDMSAEVAQYILHRASRDMNELFYLLERLDAMSLQAQRKLTVPFVKQTFNW